MKKFFKSHLGDILTGLGCVTLVAGTVVTVFQTKKAVEHPKEERAKYYILPAAFDAVSIGLFIASNRVMAKQNAEILAAYLTAQAILAEYHNEVKDRYGKETANDILKKARERTSEFSDYLCIDDRYNGDICHFIDTTTKMEFDSTMEYMKDARYHLNRNFALRGAAAISEFYDFINEPITSDIDFNPDRCGWSLEDAYEYDYAFIDITYKAVEGEPNTFAIIYEIEPKENVECL